jgi:hypothetical protein
MKGIQRSIPFLLLAAIPFLGACDDGTGSRTSRVTLKLTDAPADLAEAWVEIEQVYLQGSGGRIVLRDESTGLIDLLTLRDQVIDLVSDHPVPAGSYSEMRFVIGDAYIRTESGQVFATAGAQLPPGTVATGTLHCPSCAQSGIKVKFMDGGLSLVDDAEILVADFDVSRSFGREAGQSGRWVMHPVITGADFTFSGGIAGTVGLAEGVTLPACGGGDVTLAHFVPRALVGTDTIASGNVDESGAYRIRFVPPGSYTLGYAPSLTFENGQTVSFTAAATPATVSVTSGATASADYAISAATCSGP